MRTILDMKTASERFTGYENRRAFEAFTKDAKNAVMPDGVEFVVYDLETTGLDPHADYIVQFSGQRYVAVNGQFIPIGKFVDILIKPPIHIPPEASKTHGLYDDDVKDCPSEAEVFDQIKSFFTGVKYIVGYNVAFDNGFMVELYKRMNERFPGKTKIDVMKMAVDLIPETLLLSKKLCSVAEYCGCSEEGYHDARVDVTATVNVMKALTEPYLRLPPIPDESKLPYPDRVWKHYLFTNPNKETDQRIVYITYLANRRLEFHFSRFGRWLKVVPNKGEKKPFYPLSGLNMTAFMEVILRYHNDLLRAEGTDYVVSTLNDLTFLPEWTKKKKKQL